MAEDAFTGAILLVGHFHNPSLWKLMMIDGPSFTSRGVVDLNLFPLPPVENTQLWKRSLTPIVVDEDNRRAWIATRESQIPGGSLVGSLGTKHWLLSVDLDRVLP